MRASWLGIAALAGCASSAAAPFAHFRPPPASSWIGTAHPYTVEHVADDGSWLVLCQAREDTNRDGQTRVTLGYHGDTGGDRLEPYFVRGTGPGERFDDIIAIDPEERSLVAVRGDQLLLVDTATGASLALPAAAVDDRPLRARILDPRPAARAEFSPSGRRLAYLRKGPPPARVVVRDLERGTDADVIAGAGDLGGFEFDPSENWLELAIAPDGEFPVPRTTLAAARCRGPVTIFTVWPATGAKIVERVAPASGGVAREAPAGYVTGFDRSWLVRKDDGSLWRAGTDAPEVQVDPAGCLARIRWADPERQRVIVDCLDGSVELCAIDGAGADACKLLVKGRKPLRTDRLRWGTTPLVRLTDVEPLVFYDLERATIFELPEADGLLAVRGRRLLFTRAHGLWMRDLADGRQWRLGDEPRTTSGASPAPRVVRVGDVLVDMDLGRIVGAFDADRALTFSSRGVLVAAERRNSGFVLPRGPLWWEAPAPPSAAP